MDEQPAFAAELFSERFDPDESSLHSSFHEATLPVLLVSGADSHCTRWTPTLIEPLRAQDHQVVRYDHRDSGLSTKVPAEVRYTLDEMAKDAVHVMDAHGIDRAHVVGRSMGGMVGQLLALDHSERVATLALIATTPGLGDDRLPPAEEWLLERMSERLYAGPPSDPSDQVAWIVELDELFAGTRHPEQTVERIRVAVAEIARCWHPDSGHGSAVVSSPSRLDRLGDVVAPTLVVHGTSDPVFPVDHGLALADGIPGAELWLVEELGHELPDGLICDLLPKLEDLFAQA